MVEDIVEKETKLGIVDIVEEVVRQEKERQDQEAFKIEAERAFVEHDERIVIEEENKEDPSSQLPIIEQQSVEIG